MAINLVWQVRSLLLITRSLGRLYSMIAICLLSRVLRGSDTHTAQNTSYRLYNFANVLGYPLEKSISKLKVAKIRIIAGIFSKRSWKTTSKNVSIFNPSGDIKGTRRVLPLEGQGLTHICRACAPGFAQAAAASTACDPCDVGHFQEDDGDGWRLRVKE